ncbi:hypothetical protein EPUS_01721 [Endocarpon pusillum Z07020]|uniref:FAD dependent oxidoreductase domain-containing protein n=1 Tax=Endocarpon pusillum (strain Z07020 / HMAS-L-300199) TaxID=1263415 RepID=U1GIZ9_ENDPU|nr:uncharacterized protein EPUS_01721 [Endocarpon pusillum Z07020]ERF71806.1 hypothetical protein EPUS_01721 [Endocarpon pusillum Z07020]
MPSVHSKPLILWRDLSPRSIPLVKPDSNSRRILVVGGGVIGLVTAWVLLDHGYKVTVLAKEWPTWSDKQRLTSQIAGALWEYPPAVCGQHTNTISLSNSKRWCMDAYHVYNALASEPNIAKASGVSMKSGDFFFPCPIEEDVEELSKMEEIMASGVVGFRRDRNLVQERLVDPRHGVVDAYEILSPVIDTDVAMKWLLDLVKGKGADFVTETIQDDLLVLETELRKRFSADAIVNCTGLAGSQLAGDDTCYPIRGGLIRVMNDGTDFPKVEAAMTMTAGALHDFNEIVFIVPRNDNILLIGGIIEPHKWELDLTLESPTIKRMRARCEAFLPDLKKARVDPDYPFAQGLRPFREKNVRVERELRNSDAATGPSRIVHSYGQGGAGWSLAFGCAGDVLALVEEALQDLPPKAMNATQSKAEQKAASCARP